MRVGPLTAGVVRYDVTPLVGGRMQGYTSRTTWKETRWSSSPTPQPTKTESRPNKDIYRYVFVLFRIL